MTGGRQGTPGFDPDLLRAARKAAGMTQAELAAAADFHVKEVREWESHRRIPQIEATATLARVLGISPLELTRRDTSKPLTLQQLRAAAGLSQQAIADRAGLQRTTYSKMERGEALTLSDDDAAALAGALEVEPGQVAAAHVASKAAHLERHDPTNGAKPPGSPRS